MASRGSELDYNYSSLVVASGSDGSQGSKSLTDFRINLGPTLQKISRVSICSVTFTNSAYNISDSGSGENNTFAISIDSVVADFEVKAGFYTTTSLMATVEAAVQAYLTGLGDGQTFTLTQDTISQKVIATYDKGAASATTMLLEDIPDKEGVWNFLGFPTSTAPITLTDGVARTAANLPNLSGLKEVVLVSNAIAPGNLINVNGQQVNGLLLIPITAPLGTNQVFECKVDQLCQVTYKPPRMLQEVDFSLTDKRGDPINLNGSNLTINLKIWFNKY